MIPDMRSSLVLTGIIIAVLGLALYVLELPFAYLWSFPFMVGGVVFVLAGFFLKESEGQVEPPEGYKFCRFCNTPVLLTADRCDHCNGLQNV
jgi:hypothetical protein